MAERSERLTATESSQATAHGESRFPVLAAMAANFAIAVGKLVAGLMTGSAALLAEAGHSMADTVNQVFLLVGMNLSNAAPDEKHPHGYGKETFFWAFLAAIFIFVAGAAFSFFEGIRTAIEGGSHDRSSLQLAVGFGVLLMALFFESTSFFVAVRGVRAGAKRLGWGLWRYVVEAPDVTIKTVFFEDSAAIIGLGFAIAGLGLSELTGSEYWDAAASICIGTVLAGVSVMLGMQSRNLLLGAAASPETRAALHRLVDSFPEVMGVKRMLSMQVGPRSVLVTGELHVRPGLTTGEIEDLIARIDAQIGEEIPEVRETFWELHGTVGKLQAAADAREDAAEAGGSGPSGA
jgi:cation diffusion facilitator family transporter